MIIGAELHRYLGGTTQAPHRHDTPSITLLLRGQILERSGNTSVAAEPLSIVVKPAGVLHADVYAESEVVTCQIALDARAHDDEMFRQVLSQWRWVVGGPAVTAALELVGMIADGASSATLLD